MPSTTGVKKMYKKTCIGCDGEFETKYSVQIRCKKDCGNRKNRSRSSSNTSARDAKRVEDLELPTEFVGVDGEGFTRVIPVFVPVSTMSSDDIDKFEQDIADGVEEGWEYDDSREDMMPGYWTEKEVHQYEMFGIGTDQIGKKGVALHHTDVFEFLYDEFTKNPKAAYVGFFLGYDFTNWVKTLAYYQGWRLLTKQGIAERINPETGFKRPVTLINERWQIDLLGNKRFQLRPFIEWEQRPIKIVQHKDGTLEETRPHPHPWMFICDAGSFFQTSLLNAIDPSKSSSPIVSDEEFALLKTGKSKRDEADFDDETSAYNKLENVVLARLMSQLEEGLVSDGIKLRKNQWYGPGQAAQKWMDLIEAPKSVDVREVIPDWAEEAARRSYYGGWFETTIVGHYPGVSYAYDINSAYPYVIKTLPCLLHGVWSQGVGRPPKELPGDITLVHLETYRDKSYEPLLGGLSHRQPNGSILRPLETVGWHWWHEVKAAKKAKCHGRESYRQWVRYSPCDCAPPFASIEELYEGRLKVGKNSPAGKAKKLVYNSSYGKMAQSIGTPKYANAIYASLITAGCRTMILNLMATHPRKTKGVLMIATDGIVFSSRHPRADVHPTRLGAWDESTYSNLTIVMPGVYWDDSVRAKLAKAIDGDYSAIGTKSRGVSAKDIGSALRFFDEAFHEMMRKAFRVLKETGETLLGDLPEVDVSIDFSFKSAKLAAHEGNWDQAGTVAHGVKKTLSADPVSKRRHAFLTLQEDDTPYVATIPYDEGQSRETLPYGPLFGRPADTLFDPEDEYWTKDGDLLESWVASFGKGV